MYKRLAAEIDLDAVDFNIKSILKRIDGRAQVIGTIKADGYGHGAMEVAEVLMENGVNMFSVAAIDEAISLGIPDEEIKRMVEIQYQAAKKEGGGKA